MPYGFNFDLSQISKAFFRELARVATEKNMHRRIGERARSLAEKFRIREITGLEVSDALMIVEDLMDIYARNLSDREKFLETRKRALFLPHCSRKYMDNRCQAHFDPDIPSYQCAQCSSDCLVNKATALGRKRGYDVYVLAGSSCVPKILKKHAYEGVVGVACSQELKVGGNYTGENDLRGQAVPLTKNGCANTWFSIESLKRIL
ncbi:MAG: DUF116 domain-containing protein [Candidatus Bathyarchaeota archaeon]|nr:DUF116 domain-containing protein [Candidatus Bathyarchaeota archaeon]MDH5712432.1 DUF116 domain-containing protein [Candidatus Bathyarchaeota archaeon]